MKTPYVDISKIGETVSELERLLRFNFVTQSPAFAGNHLEILTTKKKKEPLSSWLSHVSEHHNVGNIEHRQYGLSKIAGLIVDLQTLEKKNEDLLRHFQKLYKKTPENNFWGFRFEIDVASTLVKRSINFELGADLPGKDEKNGDFKIGNVAIECTSANITKRRDSDYLYKIQSAVTSKKGKAYCSNSTALFVDITNLYFQRAALGRPMQNEEVRNQMKESLYKTEFGALVLSLWFFNKAHKPVGYMNTLLREDNKIVDPELALFLSEGYGLNQNLDPIQKFAVSGNY